MPHPTPATDIDIEVGCQSSTVLHAVRALLAGGCGVQRRSVAFLPLALPADAPLRTAILIGGAWLTHGGRKTHAQRFKVGVAADQ